MGAPHACMQGKQVLCRYLNFLQDMSWVKGLVLGLEVPTGAQIALVEVGNCDHILPLALHHPA